MKPAGFWIRFLASLIDTLILMLVAWGILLAMVGFGKLFTDQIATPDSLNMQIADIVIYSIISFVYYVIMHAKFGTTLGKMPFQIYVLDVQTNEIVDLRQSFLRCVGYLISALPLYAGFVMAAFQPEKRALHEIISSTRSVIKKN